MKRQEHTCHFFFLSGLPLLSFSYLSNASAPTLDGDTSLHLPLAPPIWRKAGCHHDSHGAARTRPRCHSMAHRRAQPHGTTQAPYEGMVQHELTPGAMAQHVRRAKLG
jgi:hypothetical protein